MARSYPVVVGTVATLLAQAPPGLPGPAVGGPSAWFLAQNGTAASIFVGGGTLVTSSNGVTVGTSPTTNSLSAYLFPGDNIYAITASGSVTTTVLVTGA